MHHSVLRGPSSLAMGVLFRVPIEWYLMVICIHVGEFYFLTTLPSQASHCHDCYNELQKNCHQTYLDLWPASYLSSDFKRNFQNYVELPLAVLEKRPAKYESQVQEGACSSHKPRHVKIAAVRFFGIWQNIQIFSEIPVHPSICRTVCPHIGGVLWGKTSISGQQTNAMEDSMAWLTTESCHDCCPEGPEVLTYCTFRKVCTTPHRSTHSPREHWGTWARFQSKYCREQFSQQNHRKSPKIIGHKS